jgi:hypothetical protein
MDILADLSSGTHIELRAEQKQILLADKTKASQGAASNIDFWTVKIEAADDAQRGAYTVYVVEVWGESKRLAVSLRRYNEFYGLREELLAKLTADGLHAEHQKIYNLPFPRKLDMGVMMMGKNSKPVRDKRIAMLAAWLNASLAILGKQQNLCRFLGVSAEYIGVTIVGSKTAESYSAHGHLFEVMPLGRKKGLSAIELPARLLFGCDETGVQLFNAQVRL